MDGAVERSANLSPDKDLETGAGESAPLKQNDDFGSPPHREEIDEQMFCDDEDGEDDGYSECGRWDNGRLVAQCRKAGSEECDWECPIGIGGKL